MSLLSNMSWFFTELSSLIMLKNKKTTNYIAVFDSLFNRHFTSLFQRLPWAWGEAMKTLILEYNYAVFLYTWLFRVQDEIHLFFP